MIPKGYHSKGDKRVNRREAREKAFQILFQIDMNDIDAKEAIDHVLEGEMVDAYLHQVVFGVKEKKEEIDQWIEQFLEHWTMKRIAAVERTLLRMAVYEIKYVDDVPDKVALNEALELAKLYGDDKSSSFIHGVLSKMLK